MQVQEVLRYTEIARSTGCAKLCVGHHQSSGKCRSRYSIRGTAFTADGEVTDATRIVIVEADEHVVGLVDSVAEVLTSMK